MIWTANISQMTMGRLNLYFRNNLRINHVFSLMSKRFLPVLFLVVASHVHGQFNLYTAFLPGHSTILEEERIGQNGVQVFLEYNHKLEDIRLEFRPGIGYRQTLQGSEFEGSFTGIDFDLGIAVYPLDFGGDCNCPTFSKQGDLIKKGFFLELRPGISRQELTRERGSEPGFAYPVESDHVVLKLGAAAGLDIGLSEFFTLSPVVSYTFISSRAWEGLLRNGNFRKLTDMRYLGLGLRLSYHPESSRR